MRRRVGSTLQGSSTPATSRPRPGGRAAPAPPGPDDTVTVNTCAVTAEAVRQAAQTIRKLKRENLGARLIVTGCAAQIEPERFADMPEVDRVEGKAEKMDLETYRCRGRASPRVLPPTHIMSV